MKQNENDQNHKKESTPVVDDKPNGKSQLNDMLKLLKHFWIRFCVCCEAFLLPKLTIPRLVWFIYVFSWGAGFAVYLGAHCGVIGHYIGFICGVIFGFFHPILLLWGLFALFYPCPQCRRGKCRHYTDFVWRKWTFFGYEKWRAWRYMCSCGDEHIFDGNRFMEVLPDGTKRPYKKLVGFRKWADDLDSQDNTKIELTNK